MGKSENVLKLKPMAKLPEIPSEFIEPYIVKFVSYLILSIATETITPAEARSDYAGLEHFISLYGGIHVRFATSNDFARFTKLPDDEMYKLCKEVAESAKGEDFYL